MQERQFVEFPLPRPLSRERLDALTERQMFAASPFGPGIAFVERDEAERFFYVRHLNVNLPSIPMLDARILRVSAHRVVIWGVTREAAGTWSLSEHGLTFRYQLDQMDATRRTPFGFIPIGRNLDDPPGRERIILPGGPVTVASGTETAVLYDGSMVVWDRQQKRCVRWRVVSERMEATPMPTPPAPFVSITPLPWRGSVVYLLRQADGGNALWMGGEVPIIGNVERCWTAPNDRSFALLIRCGAENERGPYRRLVLYNGRSDRHDEIMYSGRFDVIGSLSWSTDGEHAAAFITEKRAFGFDTVVEERRLVSSGGDDIATPEGIVTQAVVDENGTVLAYSLDDGRSDRIVSPNRLDSPKVLRAFNMRVIGQTLEYTTVESNNGSNREDLGTRCRRVTTQSAR